MKEIRENSKKSFENVRWLIDWWHEKMGNTELIRQIDEDFEKMEKEYLEQKERERQEEEEKEKEKERMGLPTARKRPTNKQV